MSIIPYRLRRRRLFLLFAMPLFFLCVFHPVQQTMVAHTKSRAKVAGQITIPIPRAGSSEAETIAKNGPLFPAVFNMSSFSVSGFVKGLWPIVIDYELEAESTAIITISVKETRQPFTIELTPTDDRRTEVIRRLPEAFGRKPQVGVLTFQAFKTGPDGRQPARFFLYGLGVGDDAVGSMVIDQLQFQPGSIRPKLKEKASYSFRSLSDFNQASAEFNLVTFSPARGVSSQLVASQILKNGVQRGKSVAKYWDGKNSQGKISLGPHQFRVRAWRGLKSGGDWVFAAETQVVKVE